MSEVPFRVGIVGGGPKAMYCLDALCEALRDQPLGRVEISVFEPEEAPGAGRVYGKVHPDYLLMNFAAENIDAWHPKARRSRGAFLDWAKNHAPAHADGHGYAPRRVVGAYLADCFEQICQEAPACVTIRHVRSFVTRVQRGGGGWVIESSDGSETVQELLVATGHQDWWGTGRRSAVFPVQDQLSPDRYPAGGTVALKGFGLTAIDAVLALTVGRGGSFAVAGEQLSYVRSGREPGRVVLISRSGRPMLAKPDMRAIELPAGFDAVSAALSCRIAGCARLSDVRRQLLEPLLDAVDAALGHAGGEGAKWFDAWTTWAPHHGDVAHLLHQSWRRATGAEPLGIPEVFGLLWRQVYAGIVTLVSHGGIAPREWPRFADFAREMERIAFGPPALNVRRLVALENTGLLTFKRADGHDRYDADATIPPPTRRDPDGLISALLTAESVDLTLAGTVAVAADGAAISKGQPIPALSFIGRITEGCVLGNDTLSRKLHDTPERWARSVLRRVNRTEGVRRVMAG